MRYAALLPLLAIAVPSGATAAEPIRIELNAAVPAQQQCLLSFVIENKSVSELRSLKLDLAFFGRDGVIARRLVAEMGPLRGAKTVVKTFEVEEECGSLGSILINDVSACLTDEPDDCLARLVPTSRVPDIKLFK